MVVVSGSLTRQNDAQLILKRHGDEGFYLRDVLRDEGEDSKSWDGIGEQLNPFQIDCRPWDLRRQPRLSFWGLQSFGRAE